MLFLLLRDYKKVIKSKQVITEYYRYGTNGSNFGNGIIVFVPIVPIVPIGGIGGGTGIGSNGVGRQRFNAKAQSKNLTPRFAALSVPTGGFALYREGNQYCIAEVETGRVTIWKNIW